jgi:arylsulfatase A-like enzyme
MQAHRLGTVTIRSAFRELRHSTEQHPSSAVSGMRLLVALWSSVLFASQTACAPASESHERVILIVVDTLRRDHVWPYDPEAATPNIRRIAEKGRVFFNAQASFHQTTMSMAALFTGRTPSLETDARTRTLPWNGRNWCGLARFAGDEDDSCLPLGVATLAEDMRAEGLWTIGIASNVFLYRPAGFDRGFDDWVQLGGGRGDDQRLETIEIWRWGR